MFRHLGSKCATIVLTLAICALTSWYAYGRAAATAITSNASAVPLASTATSTGVVTIVQTAGLTGSHTPGSETVTATSDSDTGTSVLLTPAITAGSIEAFIKPSQADNYWISVNSKDSELGSTALKVTLTAKFPATAGNDYSVHWDNDQITMSWTGVISLATSATSGFASLETWTRKPWEGTTATTEVGIAINPGASTTNKWSALSGGPVVLPISEGRLVNMSSLEDWFSVTPEASDLVGGQYTHTAYTSIRVLLNHTVAAEGGDGIKTHTSKTTSWAAGDWYLRVSVSGP